MKYFWLNTYEKVGKRIQFSFLPNDHYEDLLKKWDFTLLDPLKVGFFSPSSEIEVPDILVEPCFLVSDKIKKVFETYWEQELLKQQYFYVKEEEAKGNQEMELESDPDFGENFKGIQLVSQGCEEQQYERYWALDLEVVDCVHGSSSFYPNRMLQNLVLDREKLPDIPFFQVGNLLEHRVIVNLQLAEMILSSYPFGVALKRIEVK